jgi:glycolate oxidase
MKSGIIPSVLELLDENTVRVLREHADMSFPDISTILLVETDGYTQSEASYQMEKVLDAIKKNTATEVRTADTTEEAEELWKARKTAGSVAARLGTSNLSEDVTVPISKLPDLLTGISDIVHSYQLPFVVFGHAGDGNLHPKIMYNAYDPDQVERVHRAVEDIFKLTCELGGTLTGEHGIGLAKAPYLSVEHDPVALEIMRDIKRLLDPNNILNPGKMALGG